MEYYAAERKKEFLPFMTAWMEISNNFLARGPYSFCTGLQKLCS